MFIDYSSAFNTRVPSKLITKLRALDLNPSLCNWVLDFLMGRHQVVKVCNYTAATLNLNMGSQQGRVLSPSCTPCSPMTASHACLQLNNQVCWLHNSGRPDYQQ